MLGEIIALIASLAIAASSIISKSLTPKIAALSLQTMRSWYGSIFLVVVCFSLGKADELTRIPLPLIGLTIGSALIGIALGDTLYIRILSAANVSSVFPIVRSTQILVVTLAAAFLFDEKITGAVILGAVLIISGVYLTTSTGTEAKSNPRAQPVTRMKWLPLGVGVGICWATSWCFMKVVLTDVDPLVANSLRVPVASLMLTTLILGSGQRQSLRIAHHGRTTIALIISTGILSYGIGVLLVLYAIHLAGVSRTAILTSTTPLFVLVLSSLFLKEQLTLRLGFGTLLCVIGIILVVIL
ncbi:DMT family transporter [Chloroflexota bacterium]